MNNANIGYLFSRLMYLDENMDERTSANTQIPGDILRTNPLSTKNDLLGELDLIPEVKHFDLAVVYPGLFCGLGYAHGIGGADDTEDFKTGFFFDHTTGLPVIPGSSVKGVLRSALNDYPELVFSKMDCQRIKDNGLIQHLFGSENKIRPSVKGQAIFFDALPIEAPNGLMADDYITPHKSRTSAPMPIHTLKVKPGVIYRFRYILPNLEGFGITAEDLTGKFKQLLIKFGLGAKTNTGYGYLKDVPVAGNPVQQSAQRSTRQDTDGAGIVPKADVSSAQIVRVDKKLIEKKQVKIGIMPSVLKISDADQKRLLDKIKKTRNGDVRIKIKPSATGIEYDFIEIVE